MTPNIPSALALVLLGLALTPAAAQEGPRNLLALGAIAVPEFEGSADKVTAPLLLGRLDLGSFGRLRLAGVGLQLDLLGPKSPWAFGPVLSFRPARDGDVDDTVVRRLREVDAATEFGVFVEYGLADTFSKGDRLAFGVEAKGGRGSQLSLGLSYQAAALAGLRLGFDVRTVFANTRYMDTYFSVDADNSVRSGLPRYAASGGLKNISLGVNASVDLTGSWMLIGRVGFLRLMGDARDSPIVQLRGDPNAVSAGLAVGYRF
jgi:outer membrane scaffolding protein for murein synthesis (MipA/OmpV family)